MDCQLDYQRLLLSRSCPTKRRKGRQVPTKDEFRSEIRSQLRGAELRGATFLEINSGLVHRKIGGYPGTNHQMPSCCDAMYEVKRAGDMISPSCNSRREGPSDRAAWRRAKLGARYGSEGWYAPPGVDLSAFGERGWL
jgi:hypothetical protein